MKNNKTKIIAEIGVNHNGDINRAINLINMAASLGADFVKFQTYIATKLVTKNANLTPYQKKNTKTNKQLNLLKKYEFSFSEFSYLKKYCDKININFLSSPFDFESALFLNELKLRYIKIPSGEITNLPLLTLISNFNKNVIISTGMATMQEIEEAIKIFRKNKKFKKKIIVLHCTSSYPTDYKNVNLNTMLTIKEAFKKYDIEIGFSDHTNSNESAIAATALGATLIEKHFTLDNNLSGPDHLSSLNPKDFGKFINSIRNTTLLLGSKNKIITMSEKDNLLLVRKSIVASKKIIKGEKFSVNNITLKRPALGLSPKSWNKLIGKKSKKNYKEDEFIKE